MPRTARITIENGCYHIITRGNQRQNVFAGNADYKQYLRTLSSYKHKFRFKLYCFCLMPNHVHLLVQIHKPNDLNKIMHGINLSYTLFFNDKYKKVGHLWQDRFKSKLIEHGVYLLECIRYIEENPLRCNLAERINKYPWSSFAFRNQEDSIIDTLTDA